MVTELILSFFNLTSYFHTPFLEKAKPRNIELCPSCNPSVIRLFTKCTHQQKTVQPCLSLLTNTSEAKPKKQFQFSSVRQTERFVDPSLLSV